MLNKQTNKQDRQMDGQKGRQTDGRTGQALYLGVGEEEGGVRVLDAGVVVQLLQVVVELVVSVATTQLNLYTLVAADVGGQSKGKEKQKIL